MVESSMNAQVFVKNYDKYLKEDRINNEVSILEDIKLSVIFIGNDRGDIVFYFLFWRCR